MCRERLRCGKIFIRLMEGGGLQRGCESCPLAQTVQRRAPVHGPTLLRIVGPWTGLPYESELC